jgi:hypothetical protein
VVDSSIPDQDTLVPRASSFEHCSPDRNCHRHTTLSENNSSVFATRSKDHHVLLQLVHVFKSRQYNLPARLLNLPSQENLIEYGIDLITQSKVSQQSIATSSPFFSPFNRTYSQSSAPSAQGPLKLLHPSIPHPSQIPFFHNSQFNSLLLTIQSKRNTHLIKVKHQIQLTHVPKKRIQHLDEEVQRLEVGELVVVGVDARAEEKPRVPAVHDLGRVSELDEVGLVFLVAGRDEAVNLCRSQGGA